MDSLIDMRVFGSALVTIFVIMDPPGIVPIFMALAHSKSKAQRSRIARQATLTSLAVIVAFALLGEQVLQYLKISMPALQGAGGLLLLLVALQLLTGAEQSQHAEVDDVSVALVPLGTPLLAGRVPLSPPFFTRAKRIPHQSGWHWPQPCWQYM